MTGYSLPWQRCLAAICVLSVLPVSAQAIQQQAAGQQQQPQAPQSSGAQTQGGGSVILPLPTPIQTSNPPATTQPPASAPQVAVPPPAGVAAAPVIQANGNPGSEPSGAAIAPAKQKRRFSLVVRVGLIVGAAIAVGAVAGASLASPGRAHASQ